MKEIKRKKEKNRDTNKERESERTVDCLDQMILIHGRRAL